METEREWEFINKDIQSRNSGRQNGTLVCTKTSQPETGLGSIKKL